ncbi:hypothetical protein B0T26DRAFT_676270 [Lasiosphaeria miniovina]|uniref:Protein kinase domain-containing protein n=1 Tax=Lasiosphaeria miniovina TaxID=1954250 RepID=A0AA40ALH0_9PEZI|nr:uncharacterized protein B0T26DRAFT_676270 [Lasiosphaeria miniovina]KAK0718051.1 hypothetical protein B0T26DRAFT_676270 [Lasiosphaeria miniovina]
MYRDRWEAVPHLEIVLSHPPVDAPPPPSKKSHVLTVESLISRYGGPCLVRCYFDDDSSVSFVAKIYDAGSDNSPGRESTKHHRPIPPDAERLDMLATVVETDVQLSHAGIINQDLAPRNVIVLPSPARRIVLIDFNLVRFGPPTTDPAELPMNPVDSYCSWHEFAYSGAFARWVPASWGNDRGRAMEWLMERRATSTKFAPLPTNLGLFLKGKGTSEVFQRCYDCIFKTSPAAASAPAGFC